MFKNANIKSLFKLSKKHFQLLTSEEYLINMKESVRKSYVDSCRLIPFPEANHDPRNTRCRVYGMPKEKISRVSPLLSDLVAKYVPDLIFLQMDPMPYLARQRFLSHKCALNQVEDYDVKGVDNLNEPFPISWEESIVDPLILDMSYANQVHTKIDYTKGFVTFSSPNLQLPAIHDNLHDKFIQCITDYVISDKWSPYHEINQILYTGLMSKHKVMLGDMPELLLRQIIGNTVSIWEARDIFKSVLKQIKQSDGELDMKTATHLFYSHIFLAPKDLYMAAMLREVLKACYSVIAFVGHPHFVPIQKYWLPPPDGVNFKTATTVPKRILNETDEDLIEKQAIFDVLLGTRLWADKYITNPFPYIQKDITKIPKEDLESYKKTFFINTKKYEAFRDKIIESCKVKKIDNKPKVERLTG